MTESHSPPERPLRIAIDAQVLPWRNGGVAHALIALVRALGRLADGPERYCLVVKTAEEEAFWRPLLAASQELATRAEYEERLLGTGPRRARPTLADGLLQPLVRRVAHLLSPQRTWPEVPVSDGFYESLGCDVLHLPWQHYMVCAIPTIFNPHDLQHLHYPQFFSVLELMHRETVYPAGCRFANTVVVGSEWTRQDVIRHYALDAAKVQVILEGPPNEVAPRHDPARAALVREKYHLPESFLLYPAITWAHKNHLRLLDALAILRDERGLTPSVVFTGTQLRDVWPTIAERIRSLNLTQQVHALGFIPEEDLQVIQPMASCLVQPSLFEGSSLPIFDAWRDGVPVACARASALPEQVRDAGALFDPFDPRDIADAVASILVDPGLRDALRARGLRRLQDFSWECTAKTYRALYRRAAHVPLTDEDRRLLADNGGRPVHPGAPEGPPANSTMENA